ncbi:MAG: type II toxin-antitoxin system prevent-host-death family antitoxin [Chthoniobacterales bacterium]
MKTATVRELRNRYTQLVKWLEAGEEILITRRGVTIARLVPEMAGTPARVDWSKSAAFRMDRSGMRKLSAKEVSELLDYNKGPY